MSASMLAAPAASPAHCVTLAPPLASPAGEDGPKRALQLWRFMYYDCKWIRSLEDAAVDKGVQSGFSRAFR